MSSVNFKNPSGNCTNNPNTSYTIANESNNTLRTMNFTRLTDEKWLYVNYPETIKSGMKCFANNDKGNVCLLQETVTPSNPAQIFFSHHNAYGSNINYAILLYNPSGTPITVDATNYGYAKGWNIAEFQPWEQFFSGNSKTITVPGETTKWLLDQRNIASDSTPFSGNIRLSTTGNVIVTVLVWTGSDTTVIDGTETQYKCTLSELANNKQYTGIGEGFFLNSTNTITSTNVASGKKVYYKLASCDASNTNEIIPIHLSGANYVAQKGARAELSNLGNWGAEYSLTFNLQNTTNTSKTFRCYAGRCGSESKVVVSYNGSTKYCSMGASTSTMGTAYKWGFMDITVDPNSTYKVNFQLVHATCSNAPIYLQWGLA